MTRPLGGVDRFVLELLRDNGPLPIDDIVAEVSAAAQDLIEDGLVSFDGEGDLDITDVGCHALEARRREGS